METWMLSWLKEKLYSPGALPGHIVFNLGPKYLFASPELGNQLSMWNP
jgi:hypothetical protein